MAIVVKQSVLRGLAVKDAMRRQVVQLPGTASIGRGMGHLIKYKTNALLTLDADQRPVGVVSKTDLMGAYYAGIPTDSPLETIMSSPPLFCSQDDTLESALDLMRSHGIYRVYAHEGRPGQVAGVLAYPDIVGLLYQYCSGCEYSLAARRAQDLGGQEGMRLRVREVMTPSVMSFGVDDPLMAVMEGLSAYRFGAVLIKDEVGAPCGVVSKTDLILAYKHGISVEKAAGSVMSSPVLSCDESQFIGEAIQKMIFNEVHRLFVFRAQPRHVVGVFSLSDAARLRSGSCRACMISRIQVTEHH